MSRVLVFTATYNEVDNITSWVEGVSELLPEADMLVIDDDSPDGTGKLLEELRQSFPRLTVIHRPGKSGLASAHLRAVDEALSKNYDFLLTMDADGSHQVQQIPVLLAAAPSADFITGTRYRGGSHRAGLGRQVLSLGANLLTRAVLPTGLSEYTTSFRVLNRRALEVVAHTEFTSGGYAFFIECVEILHRNQLQLREVPIDFVDRAAGESKIPKSQIALSAHALLVLGWRRLARPKHQHRQV